MLGIGSKQIGISVDPTGFRFIQVKKNKTSEGAGSKGFMPLQQGIIVEDQIVDYELFAEEIKQWVQQEGFKGSSAILSVPTSQIIIRKMRIESTKASELRELVELEVETALRLPFEDPVYDYIPVDSDEESTTVLVYAASRKLIHSYVHVLEEAGIKVKAVEIAATALARAMQAQQLEKMEETMLISLDEHQLEIYLFHNGNPVFMRTIALQDSYTWEESYGLNGDQISEITAELSRILSFYQYSIREGASRIVDIIVTGSGEGRIQLFNGLKQSMTEISVRMFDFNVYADTTGKGQFTVDPVGEKGLNAFRVPIGLSLYDKHSKRINLLPSRKAESRKSARAFIAALLALVWLTGAGAIAYQYIENTSQLTAHEAELDELNTKLAAMQLQLKDAPAKGSDPSLIIEAFRAANPDAAMTIQSVTDIVPAGSQIYALAYKGDQKLDLTVDFQAMNDASAYLTALRKLPIGDESFMQSITKTTYEEEPEPGTVKPAAPAAQGPIIILQDGTQVFDGAPEGTQTAAAPPVKKRIEHVVYRAVFTVSKAVEPAAVEKGEGASAKQSKS